MRACRWTPVSVEAALTHDAPAILYTEPDKLEFFADHLGQFVRLSQAGCRRLSLAMRSHDSFLTYPPHQRTCETTINRCCRDQFGIDGDFSYGPFAMPRQLAARLTAMPAHLGWGWRHFAFAIAHRLGYDITMVQGPYSCPFDQRDEQEADRRHRDRQLRENLEGLGLGMTAPL